MNRSLPPGDSGRRRPDLLAVVLYAGGAARGTPPLLFSLKPWITNSGTKPSPHAAGSSTGDEPDTERSSVRTIGPLGKRED
jgi:hypothetical protein